MRCRNSASPAQASSRYATRALAGNRRAVLKTVNSRSLGLLIADVILYPLRRKATPKGTAGSAIQKKDNQPQRCKGKDHHAASGPLVVDGPRVQPETLAVFIERHANEVTQLAHLRLELVLVAQLVGRVAECENWFIVAGGTQFHREKAHPVLPPAMPE